MVIFSNSSIVLAQHVPFTLTQSPLKQFKSGIDAKYVICKEGLQLVIKTENGSPACVKYDTAQKLILREWAQYQVLVKYLGQGFVGHTMYNQTTSGNQSGYYHPRAMPPETISKISSEPLPPIPVTPTISLSKPNIIRIISVGMSPNPLKIGDIPKFTLTYQNISDNPIYGGDGDCGNLYYEISPKSAVQLRPDLGSLCAQVPPIISTNQTVTVLGVPSGFSNYEILQSGMLNVIMNLYLQENLSNRPNSLTETIQFNVNATQ